MYTPYSVRISLITAFAVDDNGWVSFDSGDGKKEIFRQGFIQAIEKILAV